MSHTDRKDDFFVKKLLALLLALGLMGSVIPVFAAGEEETDPMPLWAYPHVADAYALGLVDDTIYTEYNNLITMEDIAAITKIAADKLALLGAPANPDKGEPLVIDTTRGGLINALYQEAAAYQFPDIDRAPADYLRGLGAVCGDGQNLYLDRPCTRLEAMIIAK